MSDTRVRAFAGSIERYEPPAPPPTPPASPEPTEAPEPPPPPRDRLRENLRAFLARRELEGKLGERPRRSIRMPAEVIQAHRPDAALRASIESEAIAQARHAVSKFSTEVLLAIENFRSHHEKDIDALSQKARSTFFKAVMEYVLAKLGLTKAADIVPTLAGLKPYAEQQLSGLDRDWRAKDALNELTARVTRICSALLNIDFEAVARAPGASGKTPLDVLWEKANRSDEDWRTVVRRETARVFGVPEPAHNYTAVMLTELEFTLRLQREDARIVKKWGFRTNDALLRSHAWRETHRHLGVGSRE
jgi:hypothetical protein